MESDTIDKLMFSDELYPIVYVDGKCKFNPNSTLLDGSFVKHIVETYGFDKFREVINFHNIKYHINILRFNTQNSDIYDKLKNCCKPKNDILDITYGYLHTGWDIYNSTLEYVILERPNIELLYLIDEMRIQPDKPIWNYQNKSIEFEMERFNDSVQQIIAGTILNIIFNNKLPHNVENIMALLKIMCDHGNGDFIERLIVIFYMKNNTKLLDEIINLLQNHKTISTYYLENISSKMRYGYGWNLQLVKSTS